jgi:hypothetical protein
MIGALLAALGLGAVVFAWLLPGVILSATRV